MKGFSLKFKKIGKKTLNLTNEEYHNLTLLYQTGKFSRAFKEIEKIERKARYNLDSEICLTNLKGLVLSWSSKYQASKETFSQYEELVKSIEEVELVDRLRSTIGINIDKIYNFKEIGLNNNFTKLVDETKELIIILSKQDAILAEFFEISLTEAIANIWFFEGEFKISSDYFHVCNAMCEKHGFLLTQVRVLNRLGLIHSSQAEIDFGIDKLQESIEIAKSIGMTDIVVCSNLGKLYQRKREFQIAFMIYKETLILAKQGLNEIVSVQPLSYLISLAIEQGNKQKAQGFLIDLLYLSEKYDHEFVRDCYTYSQALFLKTSNRFSDQAEAQKLFKKIIDKQIGLNPNSLLHLSDILLRELKQTGNEEILGEIEENISKLKENAKKTKSHWIFIETCILESKISLLKLDTKKALKLLDTALKLAKEKNLERLVFKISQEYDRLLDEVHKWEKVITKSTSFEERIELSRLDDLIEQAITKRIEDVEEKPEEPISLIIPGDIGLTLYSYNFKKEKVVDDQLIGGFIAAINSFCQETFSSGGFLERIMHQDYTILLKPLESFIFSYVIKGESYSALKKLDRFVEKITKSSDIYSKLKQSVETSKLTLNYSDMHKIVKEFF